MPKIIKNINNLILEVGKELLFEKGYESLSMREIAAECDIAVGTIYNYYPSKELLIANIMLEDWQRIISNLNSNIKESKTETEGLSMVFNAVREYSDIYRTVWSNYMGAGESDSYNQRHNILIEQLMVPIEYILDTFKCNHNPDPCRFISEVILNAGCRNNVSFEDISFFILKLIK